MPFLTIKSVFSYYGPKWALEKAIFFFTKLIDSPKIRYKNVEYFNLVNLDFFLPLLVSNFFLALFLSFLSVRLLLPPFAFHILSGCPKRWVLIRYKAWKWALDQL